MWVGLAAAGLVAPAKRRAGLAAAFLIPPARRRTGTSSFCLHIWHIFVAMGPDPGSTSSIYGSSVLHGGSVLAATRAQAFTVRSFAASAPKDVAS